MGQQLFYPPAPTPASKFCRNGHWADTTDGRKWHGKQCPDCRLAANRKEERERRSDPAYREQQNANRKERRRTDPEYRARGNATRTIRKRNYGRTPEGKAANRKHIRNRRARKADAICAHGPGCFDTAAATLPQVCAHCGTDQRIEADHIIPISRGGLDCRHNQQPLCRQCNAAKGVS